jgi:glucose/mannose-6-phosphate isomerase
VKQVNWNTALAEGWQATEAVASFFPKKSFSRVIVVGMGGSGIAGQLLALVSQRFKGVEISVIDGPEVPHALDAQTVCIVCSYSGNTWETLAAFDALSFGSSSIIALASGGRLAAQAIAHNVPLVTLPSGHVPREVLPWFVGSMSAVMAHYKLIPEIDAVIERISVHWVRHGKRVLDRSVVQPCIDYLGDASWCHVWGVRGDTDAVAYRAQTQLNENSKMAAVYSCFPELNHNLLVGFTPTGAHAPIVFLHTDFCIPTIRRAIDSLFEVLDARRIPLYKPVLFGDTWEEQITYSLWWADSVSYHIGCERGHSIQATVLIDQLKQTFSKKALKHEEEPSS